MIFSGATRWILLPFGQSQARSSPPVFSHYIKHRLLALATYLAYSHESGISVLTKQANKHIYRNYSLFPLKGIATSTWSLYIFNSKPELETESLELRTQYIFESVSCKFPNLVETYFLITESFL